MKTFTKTHKSCLTLQKQPCFKAKKTKNFLYYIARVSEICIDEDIPIEIKVKIKSSFAIIQKEITEKSVNKECHKIVV